MQVQENQNWKMLKGEKAALESTRGQGGQGGKATSYLLG